MFRMIRHDGLAFIGLVSAAFAITFPYLLKEGMTANSTIYLVGAAAAVLVAVLAMRRQAHGPAGQSDAARDPDGFREFILKRGILFVLLQAPILAFFAGFFFRWTHYTVAVFIVLAAFMTLPAWVSWRKSVSRDPDEPVHHLAEYAICACSAAAAFSLLRMVLHFAWGYVYWSPWFAFGSELSGLAPNTAGALAAGAFLYTMHAITLGLAYFILFKQHTLLNAVLLLTFYLASLYSLLFPMLARFGQSSGWVFHATNWAAHLCVALACWYCLKYWRGHAGRLTGTRRFLVASLPVLLASVPVVFAFYRTAAWIEPTQAAIDEEVFARKDLVRIGAGETLRMAGEADARLQFDLQVGPRAYENYDHKTKSLDVRNATVSGKVYEGDAIVAWCAQHVESLESPNRIKSSNADYFAGAERMNFTRIPVRCVGDSRLLRSPGDRVLKVEWLAQATLVGDRNQVRKEFSGVSALALVRTKSDTGK